MCWKVCWSAGSPENDERPGAGCGRGVGDAPTHAPTDNTSSSCVGRRDSPGLSTDCSVTDGLRWIGDHHSAAGVDQPKRRERVPRGPRRPRRRRRVAVRLRRAGGAGGAGTGPITTGGDGGDGGTAGLIGSGGNGGNPGLGGNAASTQGTAGAAATGACCSDSTGRPERRSSAPRLPTARPAGLPRSARPHRPVRRAPPAVRTER